MAQRQPPRPAALPSEDFYLDYDGDEPSERKQPEIPPRPATSGARRMARNRYIQSQPAIESLVQMHQDRELKLSIFAGSFGFGFRHQGPNNIQLMHETRCTSEHDRTWLMVVPPHYLLIHSFQTSAQGEREWNTLQIPLRHLKEILCTKTDARGEFRLLFSLPYPPRMQFNQVQVNRPQVSELWQSSTSQDLPIDLTQRNGAINFAAWTTYLVAFDESKLNLSEFDKFTIGLSDHNICIKSTPDLFNISRDHLASCWTWLLSGVTESLEGPNLLEWKVRYQLEVCISQGYLSEYSISKNFITRLAALKESNAVNLLERVADDARRIWDPMSVFEKRSHTVISGSNIPPHCVFVRQAIVTPTSIYFSTPTVEMSNRILRQFSEHADRFLRVRFTDEKGEGRLWPGGLNTDAAYKRIKRCLTHGIVIGDRKFEYLASGNSQFREHGAYFFSSTPTLSAPDIRSWIGDLRDIKVVSKYMSRMGQGFSTTRAIKGTRVVIKEDKDVIRNGHTFTDGVGKISRFLAQSIAIELGLPNPLDPPSVFQFRLGGCKGVLALSPEAKGREVHIRPSQYKFSAAHEGLEIIRCSSFARADLNRQLITCLSTRGIADDVFLLLLDRQLAELDDAICDTNQTQNILAKRTDPNETTVFLISMIKNGFMTSREPFFRELLNLWHDWCLKKLKDKARIEIDQSAFVLGCTDETGTLKGHFNNRKIETYEDRVAALPEIFLRISSHEKPAEYNSITGICIVARNPSLHPGDIRVVNAVDNPRLHHLRNVVVFPQTGDRDLPSMCSGGDLDGDDYVVSWNPELMPPIPQWDVPPMPSTNIKPLTTEHVTMEHCTNFFVNHMKFDNLGRIANAWLATSDSSPSIAEDPNCHLLANLHSIAVDFPKTGVPANLPRELIPKMYPHFMANRFRTRESIYHSKTALGRIYDEVQWYRRNPRIKANTFDQRILAAKVKLPKDCLHLCNNAEKEADIEERVRGLMNAKAQLLKIDYDAALRRIMAQHEIVTEFEVWSGFVLFHNDASNDYKFHETMGELSSSLKERFRTACIDAVDYVISSVVSEFDQVLEHPPVESDGQDHQNTTGSSRNRNRNSAERMAAFAQTMYAVTQFELQEYRPHPKDHRFYHHPPLISFPWLFADVLGQIAQENSMPDSLIDTSLPSGFIPGDDSTLRTKPFFNDNRVLQASSTHDQETCCSPAISPRALKSLIDFDDEKGKLVDVSEGVVPGEVTTDKGTTHFGDLLELFTDSSALPSVSEPKSTHVVEQPPSAEHNVKDVTSNKIFQAEVGPLEHDATTNDPLKLRGDGIFDWNTGGLTSTVDMIPGTSSLPLTSDSKLMALPTAPTTASSQSKHTDEIMSDLAAAFDRQLSLSTDKRDLVLDVITASPFEMSEVDEETMESTGDAGFEDSEDETEEYVSPEDRPRFEEAPMVLSYDDDLEPHIGEGLGPEEMSMEGGAKPGKIEEGCVLAGGAEAALDNDEVEEDNNVMSSLRRLQQLLSMTD